MAFLFLERSRTIHHLPRLSDVVQKDPSRRPTRCSLVPHIVQPLHRQLSSTSEQNIKKKYLSDQEENLIIQHRLFPIYPSEESLTRNYRSLLAQLRSGHSNHLNSYKHKINAATSATCPHCNADDDTVAHMFNCTAVPNRVNKKFRTLSIA